MINNSDKAKKLIEALEKITGKKVILEYTDGVTLSKRQLGAQQATLTKGNDDCTPGQFALAYLIAKSGSRKLPQPYNTMTIEQLANDINIKKSTLAMTVSRFRNLMGHEGLTSVDQKITHYFEKFSNMTPEAISEMAVKEMSGEVKPGYGDNGHKFSSFAERKPVISGPDVSKEQLDNINKKRAEQGLKPLMLRGNRLVTEHFNPNGFVLIESQIADIPESKEDKKIIETIVKKANGKQELEVKIAEAIAKKTTGQKDLLSKYIAAKDLKKEAIAIVFYNEVKTNIKKEIITETTEKLNKLTGKTVELTEAELVLSEAQLNEWFAKGAYNKLLSMLDKAIKQVDNLNGLARFYPEPWKGDEVQRVKEALTGIFKTLTFDGRHLQRAEPRVMESVQLNEWFAMGAFNKLMRILNKCEAQAKKFNMYSDFYPEKMEVDTKLILAKIKQIWKLFNQTPVADGNVTAAADDVNKLSHKAPRGIKGVPQKDQAALDMQKQEFLRHKDNPKVAVVHANAYNQIASRYGLKPIDTKKIIDNNETAEEPVDNAQAAPEQKKKEPLSKRIINGIGKWFNKEGKETDENGNILLEGIQLNEKELNELFGLSKKEKIERELKEKIEKAAAEAKKYQVTRLVGQPGGENAEESNKNMATIVNIRIKEAMQQMPTLAELIPSWFEIKKDSTNAARVNYKGHDSIIPSNFYFITGGTRVVNEKSQENFLSYVGRELKEIARKHNIEIKL